MLVLVHMHTVLSCTRNHRRRSFYLNTLLSRVRVQAFRFRCAMRIRELSLVRTKHKYLCIIIPATQRSADNYMASTSLHGPERTPEPSSSSSIFSFRVSSGGSHRAGPARSWCTGVGQRYPERRHTHVHSQRDLGLLHGANSMAGIACTAGHTVV